MTAWFYSTEEVDFIKRNYAYVGYKVLSAQLYCITGIKRSAAGIQKKIGEMGLTPSVKLTKKPRVAKQLKKQPKKTSVDKKEKFLPYIVYIPRGRPVIRTRELIRSMENTETTARDLARATGLMEDSIRGLISNGGIPAPYASRVAKVLGIEK